MPPDEKKTFALKDYKVPPFLIKAVELTFDLTRQAAEVRARLTVIANPASVETATDLVLDGENMELLSIKLDERDLIASEYEQGEKSLTIHEVPRDREFTLESTTRLGENKDLFGYYMAGSTGLVKAETEGMRRVFYCLDRPDVLSTYTTTIIADKKAFPTLIANGVEVKGLASADPASGVHQRTWFDQLPKPTYLFGMVAGNLVQSDTEYVTQAGKKIPVSFFVPPKEVKRTEFAKQIVVRALDWDERHNGLVCDLPEHKIAAVNGYAAGASEPTGMNLFDAPNVLGNAASRTDADMMRIAEVVAHETFHYWSGDRVTIRDWFNLTFKEGLTTYRTVKFRESLFGKDIVRLMDGKIVADEAPRPDSYQAVRSLYTTAAYEKSAEIFRMIENQLGEERFTALIADFLHSRDGGTVTIEDFIHFLSEKSGENIDAYLSWFTETGTPRVKCDPLYDPRLATFELSTTVAEGEKRPIPLRVALITDEGELLPEQTLMITESRQACEFSNVFGNATPSLLRDYSAPVGIDFPYTEPGLIVLMRYDNDIVNRVDAARRILINKVKGFCNKGVFQISEELIACYRAVLNDSRLNAWCKAELLAFPSLESLLQAVEKPEIEKVIAARRAILAELSQKLGSDLQTCLAESEARAINSNVPEEGFDIALAGKRRLEQACRSYLVARGDLLSSETLKAQFDKALGKNMTETVNALTLLCERGGDLAETALTSFYSRWKDDEIALNDWFRIQAGMHAEDTVKRVKRLSGRLGDFSWENPNQVYALFTPFIANPYGFHNANGQGYQFLAEAIRKLDKINPPVAARLASAFISWDRYDRERQKMMYNILTTLSEEKLSVDVREKIQIALRKGPPAEIPRASSSPGFWRRESQVAEKPEVAGVAVEAVGVQEGSNPTSFNM